MQINNVITNNLSGEYEDKTDLMLVHFDDGITSKYRYYFKVNWNIITDVKHFKCKVNLDLYFKLLIFDDDDAGMLTSYKLNPNFIMIGNTFFSPNFKFVDASINDYTEYTKIYSCSKEYNILNFSGVGAFKMCIGSMEILHSDNETVLENGVQNVMYITFPSLKLFQIKDNNDWKVCDTYIYDRQAYRPCYAWVYDGSTGTYKPPKFDKKCAGVDTWI